MRSAIVVVAGAALAVAGCERAQADRVERSETTMTDRGERPQYLLRYDIPSGFEQVVDEVIDVELEIAGSQHAEVEMPRMITTQRFTVDKVDGKGGMHLVSETTGVRTLEGGSDARVAMAAREAAQALEGMRMTATLLPDGKTRGMRVDLTSIPKTARDQASQIEQTIDQIVAKLPDVSVGEGATWTTEETVRLSGMKVFYTFRYEVLAIAEDRATLHVDVEMSAPPQPVVTPQGSGHLDALIGKGSIDMELDLHRVVDRVTAEISMGMTMSAMNEVIDLDIHTGLQVLPAGEQPAPRAPPAR